MSDELTGRPIVVNIGNFQYDGGFRFSSTRTREYTAEYPPAYELDPGDILLVMTCQTSGGEILGIPGRIPHDGQRYLHNQRLGKALFKDPERSFCDFFYWLFRSSTFNRYLYSTASGSKILHTSPGRIEAFKFSLPPLPEQKAIAHILGALDDKIELNRRMNESLEATARAIFKSWFVDFDPVRAKMAGREPVGMSAEVAALFPESLGNNGVHALPRGWRLEALSSIAELVRVTVKPQESQDERFHHFSIPAFDSDKKPIVESGSLIKSSKYLVPSEAVLLSKLNPRIPRVWLPVTPSTYRSVCSTEFLPLVARKPFRREFLYGVLTSQHVRESLTGLAGGTSNSHQRVKPKDALGVSIVRPHPKLVEPFSATTRPLLVRVATNLSESQTLTHLRDTLLPRLVSGELRIPDAEKLVAEVA